MCNIVFKDISQHCKYAVCTLWTVQNGGMMYARTYPRIQRYHQGVGVIAHQRGGPSHTQLLGHNGPTLLEHRYLCCTEQYHKEQFSTSAVCTRQGLEGRQETDEGVMIGTVFADRCGAYVLII